jgi:hypothetical protein
MGNTVIAQVESVRLNEAEADKLRGLISTNIRTRVLREIVLVGIKQAELISDVDRVVIDNSDLAAFCYRGNCDMQKSSLQKLLPVLWKLDAYGLPIRGSYFKNVEELLSSLKQS